MTLAKSFLEWVNGAGFTQTCIVKSRIMFLLHRKQSDLSECMVLPESWVVDIHLNGSRTKEPDHIMVLSKNKTKFSFVRPL